MPFGRYASHAIQQWLKVRPLFNPKDDALFVSQQGNRLTHRSIQKRMETWGIRQGLNSHLNPHNYATLLPLTCWKRVQICVQFKNF